MINAEVTIEDLVNDPHRFGLPTLEEFQRNPDYWREKFNGRWDAKLASADAGSKVLGRVVSRQVWEVAGQRTDKPEVAERLAVENGINLRSGEYDLQPELIPEGGGKAYVLIKVVPRPRQKTSSLILPFGR